jgi:hypothetical protein
MGQVAELPQGNGDLRQEFCVAQGSERQSSSGQIRLTQRGFEKLENALKSRFGENPSSVKVGDHHPRINRETVARIRNHQEWVRPSSIKYLFTELAKHENVHNLCLDDEDYESPTVKQPDRTIQAVAPNPFWQTLPIDAPEAFMGREFWFNELIELLDKGCSCNVIGPERMGRSSILKQVCAVGRMRIQRPVEQFVYLNLRQVSDSQDFFEALCHELKIDPPRKGHALTRSLKGKQHVICLDDIEQLTNSQRFDQSVRQHLRGLIDAGLLIVLIASKKCLSELFPDPSPDSSPLYGICRRMEVPPFSPQDVEGWVNYHLGETGISFSPPQLNQLREKSKGVPGILQQLARDLYDEVVSG